MAQDIQHFAVSVAAGTPITAPQLSSLAMPARIVRGIRFRIPPGPGGVMGFRLTSGGQQVLPQPNGSWIVGDNEVIEWQLEETIESGAWQLQAYNTGVYAHSVYVTFYLDMPQRVVPPVGPAMLNLTG